MEKTLEQLLRDNTFKESLDGSEFILRVQQENEDGSLEFYVRPSDRDGDTVNYTVKGNVIGKSQTITYA